MGVAEKTLTEYVVSLVPDATSDDIKNKIYCMELAGWIERIPYSGRDYFFTLYGKDPFKYSFRPGVDDRDTIRRKLNVTAALRKKEKLPRHVKNRAIEARETAV